MKTCGNLEVLTAKRFQAELNSLGLTESDAGKITLLELTVERDLGRIDEETFQRLLPTCR